MCLLCTDDPVGCSPEAGTPGDRASRGPGSPLALCGPSQAVGLPMTCCRGGPSPGGLGGRHQKDRGMTGCAALLTWFLYLNVPI